MWIPNSAWLTRPTASITIPYIIHNLLSKFTLAKPDHRPSSSNWTHFWTRLWAKFIKGIRLERSNLHFSRCGSEEDDSGWGEG
ncbi:hypothetical protein Csa_011834 [Cucumis sativus]|nr:hypothetical protein Csa_011834 [Cucumis sativus]